MHRAEAIFEPHAPSAYRILTAFPIAAFSLTVLTDIAYWRTENLLWLHFSEWLLLAGLVFAILAALYLGVMAIAGRVRLYWPHVIGGAAVLFLATWNNFAHSADGWTAVVPYGLTLSIVTMFAMLVTGWLGSGRIVHA